MRISILIAFLIMLSCGRVDNSTFKGYELYDAGEFEKAYTYFDGLRNKHNKSSEVYKESTLMIGKIETYRESYENAELEFKRVLEKENKLRRILDDPQSIFYSDPNLYFKYEACMQLAMLKNNLGYYKESLDYIELAEEKYDVVTCGLWELDGGIRRDSLFVKNQLQLNNLEAILERLGGKLFQDFYESDRNGIEAISNLIKSNYSEMEIDSMLIELVGSVKIEGNGSRSKYCKGIWFDKEIELIDLYSFELNNNLQYDTSIWAISHEDIDSQMLDWTKKEISSSLIYQELKK